jgi:nucleoside-diphosphate-sugar epimerase
MAGHEVVALVRDSTGHSMVTSLGASSVCGRVEDESSWSAASDADAIVHSAALIVQRKSWDAFRAVNVAASRHAAERAARLGVKLVHVSSIAVYGRRTAARANSLDEDAPWTDLAPTDFYARSKRLAEQAVRRVVDEAGLSAVVLRPCVIYGERDRIFLPRVIKALRFGLAPLVGRGNNVLSVVYAGNVADAVIAALEDDAVTGSFNVANDGELTQREFLTAVGEAAGLRPRFMPVPVPLVTTFTVSYHSLCRLMRPRRYSGIALGAARFMAADNPYSSDRAHRELDWRPSTQPAEAVRRSVSWFVDKPE